MFVSSHVPQECPQYAVPSSHYPKFVESHRKSSNIYENRRYSFDNRYIVTPSHIMCWRCGARGHMRRECTAPRRVSSKRHRHSVLSENGSRYSTPVDTQNISSGCKHIVMDSGVDSHMTFDGNILYDYKKFSVPRLVSFYNGTYAKAIGIGNMILAVTQNDIISYVYLSDCLHVPMLPCHIMSVGTLVANGGFQAEFCGNSAYVMSSSGQVILCGHKINGIYQADAMVMHPAKSSSGCERGQHSFATKFDSLASYGYSKAMGSGDVSFIIADK